MEQDSRLSKGASGRGFTLLELLVSIAILAVLTTLMFAAFNQASKAWLQSENQVDTFQQARAALDFMAKDLTQAIVTTNIPFAANDDSLAFIAPVTSSTNDAVDIQEVVYRLSYVGGSGVHLDPFVDHSWDWPKKLVRRSSAFSDPQSDCWDYGTGGPCTNGWDFYYDTVNWPETSSSNRIAVLADNITYINYTFYDISNNGTIYWNSANSASGAVWPHEIGTGLGAPGPSMIGRAPAGIQITIGAIDSRAANRLKAIATGSGDTSALNNNTAYQGIITNATKYFSTFVAIPIRQP